MSKDIIGRTFMIRLNAYGSNWDMRRVAPKITISNCLEGGHQVKINMCPLMKYCSRLDPKLQKQFN